MPNSVLANSPRKQICKLNDHAVRSDDSTIKDDESSSPLLVEEIKKSQLDVDCSNTFKGQSGNNESTKIDTPYLQNSPVNKTRQEAKITGNVTYSPRKSSSKAIMAYRNPVAPMHSPRSIENTASTSISRKPPIVAPKSKPLKVLGAILKTGQPVVFDTPQSDLCKSQDTSLAAESFQPSKEPHVGREGDPGYSSTAPLTPANASEVTMQPPASELAESVKRLSATLADISSHVRHSLRLAIRDSSSSFEIPWDSLINSGDEFLSEPTETSDTTAVVDGADAGAVAESHLVNTAESAATSPTIEVFGSLQCIDVNLDDDAQNEYERQKIEPSSNCCVRGLQFVRRTLVYVFTPCYNCFNSYWRRISGNPVIDV